ncbi:MAG: BMP family ABC transporter substrate-binding protein [Bacillota bacterium]|jgi:basic membrane protein A
MKKFMTLLALGLVLALSMVALVGCGGGDEGTAEEPAADATTIGFIYIGSPTDGGYTQAQDEGTQAVEEYFGDKVNVLRAENVAEEKQDVKNAAINMIDQGATIIVGTSYGFMDALEELAGEYPDVDFLHFSGNKMNDTNFGNYFGAMEEPRYLAGMIAGLTTETNKLGYVAAFPYTEVNIGINAYFLGARAVNPDVTMQVVYVNSWNDPANEKAAAEALLQQGCDIIEQHGDSTGPQAAVQDFADAGNRAFSIGYNLNNTELFPETFLGAPIWHHDAYLIPTIEKMIEGSWTPESYYGTMADGYLDLAVNEDIVPEDIMAKVNEVKDKMLAGEFPVFVGPLTDNAGNVVVAEGETLDREGIWKTDWLLEGITASDK